MLASALAGALGLLCGCSEPGCRGIDRIEQAAIPAFPATRDALGVAWFRVEDNQTRRTLTTAAMGDDGQVLGRFRADVEHARWPGQRQTYPRPTRLDLRWGDDALAVTYAVLDDDRFAVALPAPSASGDARGTGPRRQVIFGNPAYPARCRPGALAAQLTDAERRALAGWTALLPDLSTTAGTVYNHWSATTFALNRTANMVAVLCCGAGDPACCRAGPYQ
jgi:hypothetical protein